jgi:GntR family transcriptional regulator/MocR family aminotransferase
VETMEDPVVLFLGFERGSGVPFYRQIYEGYRQAIIAGRVRPGQRLASTRALASELGISRMPVLNAYEQLLHEGYVEGKVGSGTRVADTIPDDFARPEGRTRAGRRVRPHIEASSAAGAAPIPPTGSFDVGGRGPFRVSLPALDRFPRRLWARLVARHARSLPVQLMAYGDPAGYPPLREAIAGHLQATRAVKCEPSQVLIVSGSQMALHVCAMALLGRGDVVCLEEPGYPGARGPLQASGATLESVPVDDEGIDAAGVAAGKRVRMACVTPSHQYPLGTSMSASRRLELLRWAEEREAWILEDDYDSEYRYASRPLGALQGMDRADRVIYVGTFSKVLFPSLRLGFVVAPPSLVATLVRLREEFDIFSPTLYQVVLAEFLREGHFARHVRRMRTIYLARRNCLLESLRRHAGDVLTIGNADAGLHLPAFLPPGVDDRQVVGAAKERGISAMALSECYRGPGSRSGLILGFGGADEGLIDGAVKTMAEVIRDVM